MWERNSKILRLLPILGALGVLTVLYLLTCPRDLSWAHHSQDSGDLITCAHILGIPHPTGYPLFTMVGHLFTRIDLEIFSANHIPWNNSAFKMTLFVILTSLANLYMFWWIHCRLQHEFYKNIAGTFPGSIVAAIAAMVLGTSYLYWSQSIVAEVYILNLFFVNLTLLTIITLIHGDNYHPKPWRWFTLGLVAGLGLFNHLSFGLFIPGFIILAISILKKPNRNETLSLITGFLIALLPLLYLPIRSLQDPPVDTTNPESWGNFFHHITAAAYRQFLFHKPIKEMIRHIHPFDLAEQFGFPGVMLICTGIIGTFLTRTRLSRGLLAFSLLSTALVILHAANYTVTDRTVFFLPAFLAMAHLLAFGSSFILGYIHQLLRRSLLRNLLIIFLIIGGGVWLWGMARHAYAWGIDVSENQDAKQFGSKAFANLDDDAIIFTVTDGRSFSLIYHRYVIFKGVREDVDIIFVPRIHAPWWWENVADGNPNVKLGVDYRTDRNAVIADIIRTNISERPVYTAWPTLPIPVEYTRIKVGNIFRILPVAEYKHMTYLYHIMSGTSGSEIRALLDEDHR